MVQRLSSERKTHELATTRSAIWCIAVAGALLGGAGACATGVDVSQAELAEICSEHNIDCVPTGNASGSGGASGTGALGTSGSSGSGTSGSFGNGGTLNNSGGTTGTSGSSGSSGSSGASGSAGSSGTVLPLAKGMCMSTSSVVIVYTDRGKGPADNQATMTLHVQNDGASFDLADLTMRYWFTDDGVGTFTFDID
jgi:hypothetical protein